MRAVELTKSLHLVTKHIVVDLLLCWVLILQLVHFLKLLVLVCVVHGLDPLSLAKVEVAEQGVDAGLVVYELTVELSRLGKGYSFTCSVRSFS